MLSIDREVDFHSLQLFLGYLYVKSKHCFISTEKLTQILHHHHSHSNAHAHQNSIPWLVYTQSGCSRVQIQ
ncbi:hypothetical protein SeLEV6574_g05366 [Synchytrium endobioticum]|uniref:Uncharacterized protein n=1 Tax=Synchytrium endobioticum TaxID=286115 RepID=A0A507CUS6_9FUNG|nr:hypothetical protein SeLEV6574_g05366 [Synchytrium endobioticum]